MDPRKHAAGKGSYQMNNLTQEEFPAVGKLSPNTLVHGDCLEAMTYIEDQSIDMILADLPYG